MFIRNSSTSSIRTSRVPEPPKVRNRRLFIFEIKTKWSIQNQIMISLTILASLTFIFISSIVITGLFLTKDYFVNYSNQAIRGNIQQQYQRQAQVVQNNLTIDSKFNPALIPTYEVVTSPLITALQNDLGTIYTQAESGEYKLAKELNIGGQQVLVAGYMDVEKNNTFPYSIVLVLVPTASAYKAAQQLQSDTDYNFSINFYTTVESIGTAFAICLILGLIFTHYIIKPLKDLTIYAQSIYQNTTKAIHNSKKHKILLANIKAKDKIGELVEVFKSLIQGLAGLKQKNTYKRGQEIQPGAEAQINQDQDMFSEMKPLIEMLKNE